MRERLASGCSTVAREQETLEERGSRVCGCRVGTLHTLLCNVGQALVEGYGLLCERVLK